MIDAGHLGDVAISRQFLWLRIPLRLRISLVVVLRVVLARVSGRRLLVDGGGGFGVERGSLFGVVAAAPEEEAEEGEEDDAETDADADAGCGAGGEARGGGFRG